MTGSAEEIARMAEEIMLHGLGFLERYGEEGHANR